MIIRFLCEYETSFALRGRTFHVSTQRPRTPTFLLPCNSLQQLSTCEAVGDRKTQFVTLKPLFDVMGDAPFDVSRSKLTQSKVHFHKSVSKKRAPDK
jgi:hypothetical protein